MRRPIFVILFIVALSGGCRMRQSAIKATPAGESAVTVEPFDLDGIRTRLQEIAAQNGNRQIDYGSHSSEGSTVIELARRAPFEPPAALWLANWLRDYETASGEDLAGLRVELLIRTAGERDGCIDLPYLQAILKAAENPRTNRVVRDSAGWAYLDTLYFNDRYNRRLTPPARQTLRQFLNPALVSLQNE